MLTPSYRLTIGGERVDTSNEPQASTLVDLDVQLDMGPGADRFVLRLGQVGGFQPSKDDDASIEIGYIDEEFTTVMNGTVDLRGDDLQQGRLCGYGAAAILLRTFVDETFLDKTAGEVVRELASRAGVSVGEIGNGPRFPAYVIDSNNSAYRHMMDLARLAGFDLYIDAENALVFKAFGNGNEIHPLRYSVHILALDIEASTAPVDGVEAWGEGPGAAAGAEAWAWLTKDFESLRGQAGGSDDVLRLQRSALRTAEAAQDAADAEFDSLTRRRRQGRVLLYGYPNVALGDAIRLQELPDEALNRTYQVRSIAHRLNKVDGYVTEIGFRDIAANGAGGLPI